jgi:alpha-beta hydrolase superfamily lysophospholipase
MGKWFLNYDPDSRQPWRGLMADNNPGASPIRVPVLIAQGGADTLVIPQVTTDYVRGLCRTNKVVSYLMMPGIDHGLIAEKSASRVLGWIEDRFKGAQAPGTCGR